MTRVAVTGAAGRMGSLIVRLVHEADGLEVTGAVERPSHPDTGRDAGDFAGTGPLGVAIVDDFNAALGNCDVVIDFTSAEASMAHLDAAVSADAAIIIASTGFTPEQKAAIRGRREGRVFFAPNMSVGMNVLFKLVEQTARLLGDDFDVEIIETHHRFKKDAPSGSAKGLAEAAAAGLDRNADEDCVHGREGLVGERTTREIGVHAVRAGDVVGDHTVIFGAPGERLELTHKATSREVFAQGALRAAKWIVEQPRGVYDMMDLLGLK